MATLDEEDILKGKITHKKEDIPKASGFLLLPGVVVSEDDDVLFVGNYTSDGVTAVGTVFKGYVDEVSVTDAQKVKLLSKAVEIDSVKPVGNLGNWVENIIGDVITLDCSEVNIVYSSGDFEIHADADISTGTWSKTGAFPTFWQTIEPDNANNIQTGIPDDTIIFGLDNHALPGPEHYSCWKINVIIKATAQAGGWLYVSLLKDGEWVTIHQLVGAGWAQHTFSFEGYGFDETDLDAMQLKFTTDCSGTFIEDVWIDVYWHSYEDSFEKTLVEVSDQITKGEKTARQIFNWAKLQELKTWYLDPDLKFYFNDGDVDSGVDIGPTEEITRVKGDKQIKSFDKVILLGGYVNGVQLTSTSGVGDIIYTDLFANVIDQDTLDDLADQILLDVAEFPLRVQMFRTNPTEGFIQPGEEVTIEAGIQFSNSSVFIGADQYILEAMKYYIVNGVHTNTDLVMVDGLTFKKKATETAVDQETQTLISQVSDEVVVVDARIDDEVTIFPIGAILMYSGTWVDNVTIPGWYKCDGNNGTVNLVNKFIRGAATSGGSGGADTHTLIEAEIPSHTHTLRVSADFGAGNTTNAGANNWAGAAWRAGAIGSTGGGGAHNNIPAYYALIFIQRIA